MKRREFIALLGGAAASWPLAAGAQQAGKLPTIGVLGSDAAVWSPWLAAFGKRLRELGWIEGRSVTIEYRWDDGSPERAAEIAAEFIGLKVDVIVTTGSVVPVLKSATPGIPIVFAMAIDPVASGLVASLARPGGNATGLSDAGTDIAGKRLELLRQAVPNARRLAIMANVDNTQAALEYAEVQAAARKLGLAVTPLEIRRVDDIQQAFTGLDGQADALYPVVDALVAANRTRIITLALAARLPTIFTNWEYVQAGGLMSYGPSFSELFRRTAEYVDKILRGTKPADLPVEQPTKFDLAVNLTTAKALGLTIPPNLLALADEVLE